METLIHILFATLILGGSAAFLSMEYYARKAKVAPAPSVPWMRAAVLKRLQDRVKESGKDSPVILELGSGWGALAIGAAKACPHAHIIGYEISPVPLWISKIRSALAGLKNTSFKSADIFKEDLSQADFILTYLTMPHMESLKEKFENELCPGTIVICNTFPVPGWTPIAEETISQFVYELKVFTFKVGSHDS